MNEIQKINDNIHRLTIPFKDVFTTVYSIKTDSGVLLFDVGSYDEDVENYILSFLDELNITSDMLKYVFVSHNHKDHAGGLNKFIEKFPKTCIVSGSPQIKEQYKDYNILMPDDNDIVLNVLKIITIPGHTQDSSAVYDTRTKTLISGDCLQLYGLYGSGKWGSNISYIKEHIDAIDKLRQMEIEHILTAHDYHPYGYSYRGETVTKALDACIKPLDEIKDLIIQNPDADDEKICAIYNSFDKPTLGVHVVSAVRRSL
ncbi:MAG: MBL fold metallo-hydrolase [Clostridia bacterium]|nr:MBL fold metallo-hydrolase [Clostridia bacterium]